MTLVLITPLTNSTMSRTINEISQSIKESFVKNETIRDTYDLKSDAKFDEEFSVVSIEAILIYVFASAIWLHEKLWSQFRQEVETLVDSSYVTSIAWYYRKALEFQDGYALAFDDKTHSFRYPKVDEAKRIVKYAAIREVVDQGVTKLKVYFSDGNKQPLTEGQFESFESYMRQIGAAGTHYLFVSREPDKLQVHMHIYYDPLVLDGMGERINGGGKPVEETIEKYLNSLEYGGVFYASELVDMVQKAEGVKDVTLDATTWTGYPFEPNLPENMTREVLLPSVVKDYLRRIDAYSGAFVYDKGEGGNIQYSIN